MVVLNQSLLSICNMEEVTNAVLLERLDNFIEQNKVDHDRIEQHVIKTNGSVASLKMWRAVMQGAIAVLTAIVVPLLFMFLSKWMDK